MFPSGTPWDPELQLSRCGPGSGSQAQGRGCRGQARPCQGGRPAHQHSLSPSSRRPFRDPRCSGKANAGRVRTSPFLETRLGCRALPSPGTRNPPAAGKDPNFPGALPPGSWSPTRRASSKEAASRQPGGLPAASPAIVNTREPVSPGVSNYRDMSNMYVSDITKEVRAWRSEGRNAGLSLSFRMCVTQRLFSACLIFNFL